MQIDIRIPEAFRPLVETPCRYKGAYGGRGGAKSHFFAEQALLKGFREPVRIVCIREVQNSIKESCKQLIEDKIQKFGLGTFFEVLRDEIRGANGSVIAFKGMQSYNAENIKSLEDYDLAWVEEAQTLSERSLRMLAPTIRKKGSELWFSWNPRHEDDPVDKFFRASEPDPDILAVRVGWQDNPWFEETELPRDMERDYARDPEMADHVWGGGYELVSEASYYSRLITQAENEGRIGDWPYDPQLPVSTAWDIGVDDYTAIWFLQHDGANVTAIDYHEYSGMGAEQIVPECMPELNPNVAAAFLTRQQLGREKGWRYDEHFLPHDVKVREWGAGRQRSLVLMGLGVKPIHVGAAQSPVERISATRKLLPLTRFKKTKRVMVGISRLRRYSRTWSETLETFGKPLHDENSHGADAFGEYAVNCGLIAPQPEPEKPKEQPRGTVYLPGPPQPRVGRKMGV